MEADDEIQEEGGGGPTTTPHDEEAEDADDIINLVSAIEKNCIAPRTKQRYHSTLFQFIIWLYKNKADYPELLREAVYDGIRNIEEDEVNTNARKRNQKIRKFIVKDWLEKMERTNPLLCPVDTTKIDYNICSVYMAQKKGRNGERYLGRTSYCGIRSSFIYLFTMTNQPVPLHFREQMATLLKGFKRTIVSTKVENGESLDEGKEEMSFACYKLLCDKFMMGEKR